MTYPHPHPQPGDGPAVEVLRSLDAVAPEQWNALVRDDDPFLEHEFLYGLEVCGVVGANTAWQPRYLLARDAGALVGAAALFIKYDSYGEYIFDWAWADAYNRAGLSYYPKAVVAAPFTPVSGNRLLVHPRAAYEPTASALLARMLELVEEESLSSLHLLFTGEREHELLSSHGLLPRITHQFHWENRGYADFDEFLGELRSKKRKHIVIERRKVAELGLDIDVLEGEAIGPEHMEAMWGFYLDTVSRKWSQAYLNKAFFDFLLERFRHRLVMVVARAGGRLIAATLNFRKNGRLSGRYWGTSQDHPGLHFECCYYRLLDYAIARGLSVVEAGAQGEHKFLRGFAARPTYSTHWIADAGARRAVSDFLDSERSHTLEVIKGYNAVSPLKHVRASVALR